MSKRLSLYDSNFMFQNTLIGRDVYDDDGNPDPGIPVEENT